MVPKSLLYYGSEDPPRRRILLGAGPLAMIFEQEAASLDYITLGQKEVIRSIYAAVRDRNWGTIIPRVSNLSIDTASDGFRLTFEAECREREIDFGWRGTLTGDARGTVIFSMDGVARSTFLRNRVGFCVLHSARECAGRACLVEQVDGEVVRGVFPRHISPAQPFSNIRAISHEVSPDAWAEVRLVGDTFEMEDQRNWTDASYKTYCTPLSLPFPVEVREGMRISQSVTLTLRSGIPQHPADVGRKVTSFSMGTGPSVPLPRIGLGMASHGRPLSGQELARLKALRLSHLRVDLRLSDPTCDEWLNRASREASALGVGLEAALFLPQEAAYALKRLRDTLDKMRTPIYLWLVFSEVGLATTRQGIALAREHLANYEPSIKFGGGTNAYFAEFNRNHPPVDVLDLVCYSVNPQVHTFDNASLVETLEAQAWTVESARQFVGSLPVAITPVTLKPRFNPVATGPEPEPPRGSLPPQVDVRQMSLLGAGWTAGSLKYVAERGVSSITFYETTGWRGVMETAQGSPLPEKFRSLPGAVFPLYHVLADVGEFAGSEVVPSTSSDPLTVQGLAVRRGGQTRVVLANMTGDPQQVEVRTVRGEVLVHHLDERNALEAMRTPEGFRTGAGERHRPARGTLTLPLLPYATARIDMTEATT